MTRPIKAANLLPRIGVKLWHCPDKKDSTKEWWGWTIEVFSLDTNGMPVVFKKLQSHMLGTKSRLWDSEEKAQKDSREMVLEVERRVKAAFERGKKMGGLRLIGADSVLE